MTTTADLMTAYNALTEINDVLVNGCNLYPEERAALEAARDAAQAAFEAAAKARRAAE